MDDTTTAPAEPLTPVLLERTVADALRSYAGVLGCPVGYLETSRVRRHIRRTSSDDLIHTFSRDGIEIVSLPGDTEIAPAIAHEDVDELLAITRAERVPGAMVDLRGTQALIASDPAAIALVDQSTLQQRPAVPASLVYEPSAMVIDMLRGAVSPSDWREGGGETSGTKRVGALSGGVLVALATVEAPHGRLARVRVVVAPTHRRRGYGATVLQTLARRVIGDGFLPCCRLAVDDLSARTLARAVGFVTFARALSLRVVATSSDQVVSG